MRFANKDRTVAMVVFEEDIKQCVKVLEQGGSILYPTDTIWGIGCDALNEEAIEKVFLLKNRPATKSFIVLLAEAKDILKYVAAPPPDIIDIVEGFEQPTTVIYGQALDFPANAVGEDGSIAIRVVKDLFCKTLIKRYRKPLVSTSANLSGGPSPATFRDIDPQIKGRVDYIVRYKQQVSSVSKPSRIIKIRPDGTQEIIRG